MWFGPCPVAQAEGAILAHSQQLAGKTYKKGKRLTAEDVTALAAGGVEAVIVARLEAGDLDEDTAARRLAEACAGDHLRLGTAATGRVNLFAAAKGLAVYDRARLDSVNLVDEALTVAAVDPFTPVEPGQIVATIKVVPLGAPERQVTRAAAAAQAVEAGLLRVAPFQPRRAGLLQTSLPGTRDKVLSKTRETVAARMADLGGTLAGEERVTHAEAEVAAGLQRLREAGCDLVLVVGASATTDRRDTIPAGIQAAGGTVRHYGMPVDPGNLLVVGALGDGTPVLALPGSARSPKMGGNDWVLWRICAGLEVTSEDIMRMGAGGLLKEIPARPLPRAEAAPEHPRPAGAGWRIAAVILAAGRSTRMGGRNKLLERVQGRPLLLAAVDAALASRAEPVVVVTGHERERIETLLADRRVTTVHNPDYAEGLSTSLKAGVAALPGTVDGALILLGDMPGLRAQTLDRLIDAFDPAGGHTICVPLRQGRRGNPALFARRFFPEMQGLAGDVGARRLLEEYGDQVVGVEMPDDGVLVDLDTPDALKSYTGASEPQS